MNDSGVVKLGNVYSEKYTGYNFAGNVWDLNYLCPALLTMQGGGKQPMIVVEDKMKVGQISSKGSQCGSVYSDDGNAPTLCAGCHGDANPGIATNYRIRKLTPKECFRLMGFSDEDYEKAKEAGVSNSQLYKQAGNSIVVDVLDYIFKQLYIAMPYLFDDLKVSSYFSGIGAYELALNRLYLEIDSENFTQPQVG